jgi:hypothetical protein
VAGLFLAWAGPASAVIHEFTLAADGPCAGTPSAATATGSFTLNTDTGNVDWEMTLSGISGETGKHVHAPYDSCETMGGVILVFLPVGNDVSGSYVLTPQEQQDMLDGKHWINIHTAQYTGGEIRGLIELYVPPTPTVSEWGLAVMMLLGLTAGTIVFARRGRKLAV